MVFSELAAATLIAICGLKNSYRIILRGEKLVRRTIRQPAPVIDGYQTFPRYFIRRIFRAGLVIAMRWEGRAKNAAQIAADARVRARKASTVVAKRAEDVRTAAQDMRERAEIAKKRAVAAKDSMVRLRENVQERISRASPSPSSSSSSAATTTAPKSPSPSTTRKFTTVARSRGLADALTYAHPPSVQSRF